MKKFSIILALLFVLTGCNKLIIDTNWVFNKAFIDLGNNQVVEVEVYKWDDYTDSDMVQIVDTKGNVYLTHSSKVVLIYEP